MLRRLARVGLIAAFAVSLAVTLLTGARIAANPALAPLRDATVDEVRARIEQMMLAEATPAVIEAAITTRLAEQPRNWLALDALSDLAAERGMPLPPPLANAVQTAHDDDNGYLTRATACAACAYDVARCSLEQVMICQAPIALTPIGDIAGITRAGVAYASDIPVDQIDLALSVVGLGATAAILASGGGSSVVKAGAGLARMARGMGRLSPKLMETALRAAREGVNWAALPGVRSLADLRAVIRAEHFAPLTATLADLDRLRQATNATTALHLLPLVENASEARRMALGAEALGPKLVGRVEVLGKARLMRSAVRVSSAAWATISGLAGLFLTMGMMVAQAVQTFLLRVSSQTPRNR